MVYDASDINLQAAVAHLLEDGYLIVQGLIGASELTSVIADIEAIFDAERESPFDPGDGPSTTDDQQLTDYYQRSYTSDSAEVDRLVRRVRYDRHLNLDTPWPVPVSEINKAFLHVPSTFDDGRSRRIWNLPQKLRDCGRFIENQTLLALIRPVLGQDCVLSDISATSIGPHTSGGAWHVDSPFTQLPDPLPEMPLSVQNAWLLDEFTAHNGATRLVPGSHEWRRKPEWGSDKVDGEIVVEAPAGSLAMWLSNTWHRSGPNSTDAPRRALLGYYSRSWVKPFSDYTRTLSPEVARGYSPTARYLLGYSAYAPRRG